MNAQGERAEPPPATEAAFLAGDPLRALAIAMVFIFHEAFGAAVVDGFNPAVYGDTRGELGGAYGGFDRLLELLPLVVYIFFSLSAYLLSRRFLQAYVNGTRQPSIRNFLRNRVLRIVPAFWVVFLIGTLRYGTNGSSIDEVLAIPLFLQVYIHGPATDIIAHAWTVDTEWALYLGIPLAAVLLGRTRATLGRRGRIAVVIAGMVGIYITSMAFRGLGPEDTEYQRAFWAAGWSFIPGIGLALAEVLYADRLRAATWGPRVALAGVAGLIPVAVAYSATDPLALGRQAALATIAVTLIVGSPLVLQWTTGRCWRVLDNAPLRWLGERSYSFYLLHFLVGVEIANQLGGENARRDLVWTVPLGFAITAVAASASYRYVEAPFLRRKRRQAPTAGAHSPEGVAGDDLVAPQARGSL